MANTRKNYEGEEIGDEYGDLDYIPRRSFTPPPRVEERPRATTRRGSHKSSKKSVLVPGYTDTTDTGMVDQAHLPFPEPLTEEQREMNKAGLAYAREALRRAQAGEVAPEVGATSLDGMVEQEPVVEQPLDQPPQEQ